MPTHVHKFGGTSVKDAERIAAAADLLATDASKGHRVVGVSSAMSQVTNAILAGAAKAATGDREAADTLVAELKERHHAALGALRRGGQRTLRCGSDSGRHATACDRLSVGRNPTLPIVRGVVAQQVSARLVL